MINNNYQQASKLLFIFVPGKAFSQSISISPHTLTMLKTLDLEFSFVEIRFTNQNNNPYEIKHKLNTALVIG